MIEEQTLAQEGMVEDPAKPQTPDWNHIYGVLGDTPEIQKAVHDLKGAFNPFWLWYSAIPSGTWTREDMEELDRFKSKFETAKAAFVEKYNIQI